MTKDRMVAQLDTAGIISDTVDVRTVTIAPLLTAVRTLVLGQQENQMVRKVGKVAAKVSVMTLQLLDLSTNRVLSEKIAGSSVLENVDTNNIRRQQ